MPGPTIWGGTIAGLVLSIASFFCLSLLGSIPGLILGIVGLKKCKNEPHIYGGKGLAIAAIAVGALSTLFWLTYIGIMVVMLVVRGSGRY